MKLLCTVLNAIALLAILLLGTVSAHAESAEHSHQQINQASEINAAPEHVDLQGDTRSPGDPQMHCGAPILGPEPLLINFAIWVSEVSFYPEVTPALSYPRSDNLRPPRA